jgi:tetratricopeptide (TPR) repeat protein
VQYWQDRGRWHHERREYEQSVSDLTRAIELDAENADSCARRGAALVKLKRWDEALRDLNDAIRISPESSWAYLDRSQAHQGLEIPEAALSDAERAAELNANNKWAWLNLAQISEGQQQWERVAAGYGKFLSFQPDDSRYWIPYANALLASGQLEEYRTFCTELVKRNANSKDPKKARLIIYCLNKAPNAIEDWAVPIRFAELVLASEKPSANHVSLLFVRAGQYRRSIELQEQATREAQRELNAWDCLRLALAHHGLGDVEQARNLMTNAEKLAAENTELTMDSNYQKLHQEVSELVASKEVRAKKEQSRIPQNTLLENGSEK